MTMTTTHTSHDLQPDILTTHIREVSRRHVWLVMERVVTSGHALAGVTEKRIGNMVPILGFYRQNETLSREPGG